MWVKTVTDNDICEPDVNTKVITGIIYKVDIAKAIREKSMSLAVDTILSPIDCHIVWILGQEIINWLSPQY